ncbi:unnamed protein product [Amoebophrya sp. A120]|nr:unnamed protein product [Amoebophrya sp. A120]|eukprot:GSA120T00007219001.1
MYKPLALDTTSFVSPKMGFSNTVSGRGAGLLALVSIQVFLAVPLTDARFLQPAAVPTDDGGQDYLSAAMDGLYRSATGTNWCSCECCQSRETETCQKPSDFPSGSLGYQCGFSPPLNLNSETNESEEDTTNTSCQPRCLSPNAGSNTNTPNEEATSRFCELNCKVTNAKNGANCEMLAPQDLQKTLPTEAREGGNPCEVVVWSDAGVGMEAFMKQVPPKKLEADGSGDDDANKDAKAELAAEEEEEKKVEEKKKYEIDLRGLFGRTKMAQAASDLTAAKSDAARASYAKQRALNAAAKVAQVQESLLASENVGSTTIAEAELNLKSAKEEYQKVRQDYDAMVALSKQVAGKAAALAVEKIKKTVEPLAEQIGKSEAEAYGWNNPDFYPRVIAARAAEPYQQQMSTAAQRTSEYDSQARKLIELAIAKQKQAAALADQLILEKKEATTKSAAAPITMVERAEKEHEIRALVKQAQDFEAQAKSAYATAESARGQITAYQQAAFQAAEVVAHNYTATFAAPPT